MKKNLFLNIILPVFAACLLLFIWFLVAKAKNNPLILPYPKEVLTRFFLLWKEKHFVKSIWGTLGRTFLCFSLSFVFAFLFSLASHLLPWIENFLSPIISVLRSAPTVAVILIFYAFMPAKKMSVAVGFLIGFPILYSAFLSALSGVDKKLVTMAKVYKAPLVRRIHAIYVPSMLPTVLDSSRSTLSLLLKVVIAAEILTLVPFSLGGKIQTAYASFEISYLLAWTLLAIVLSYIFEIVLSLVKALIVRWQK